MDHEMADRYIVIGLHAYASHGQLDKGRVKEMNERAAEGYRIVAATGWAVIMEQPRSEQEDAI
jgi:hypothetical protein